MDTKCHFFAKSHDKGTRDGTGGTIKRAARKASLQNPYEKQSMTPRQLYEWVVKIPSVIFEYCTVKTTAKK
jgi:hypothetical protein